MTEKTTDKTDKAMTDNPMTEKERFKMASDLLTMEPFIPHILLARKGEMNGKSINSTDSESLLMLVELLETLGNGVALFKAALTYV